MQAVKPRALEREKAAACAATFALRDGYYPIGLTNSDTGDDSSADDCNSGRGSDKGNSGHGNNIGDVHAYELCGSGHSRLAPCPQTMTSLCLGLDEAI